MVFLHSRMCFSIALMLPLPLRNMYLRHDAKLCYELGPILTPNSMMGLCAGCAAKKQPTVRLKHLSC